MEFKEFSLYPDLQRGIADAEYITCMPVQEQVLTHAFGGQDLYVQSQTGTGKTAAFLVVIFQRLLAEDLLSGKKALIMAPTRELAVQIEEEAKMLAKHLPFKIGSFYGGVGYTQQEKLLRDNVQIMVGTPGRVLDLNKSGKMNLMDIAFLVLDEADRMFDMGFYPDLRKLIKVVPPADRRQTMLFSATLNSWVKNLAWEYTRSPFEIEIKPEIVTVEEVDQILYHVPSEEKMRLLLGILQREQPESAIIFCNTKRYTEIIAKRLRMNGYECEFIIGDLPQVKRLKVIEDVKAGKTKFLVATDVAARGLDIESLAMVVNYDLPNEAENYVHRIGRTARAGKTGKAVTLASEQDVYELPAIERYIGKKIPSEIATPELHGEDASEGQFIRTDVAALPHEDRGEERAGAGRKGRSQGRGRNAQAGGGRSRGRLKEERRDGKAATAGEGRRQDRRQGRSGPFPEQSPGRDTSCQDTLHQDAARQDAAENLSRLNFDERMALYKQKYNSGKPDAENGKTEEDGNPENHEKSRRGSKNKRNAPSRQNEQVDAKAEGKKQGKITGRMHKHKERKAARQQPADKAVPNIQNKNGQTEPAKKGIFSRLMGLIRKK